MFSGVTGLTKRLNVPDIVSAAFGDWLDMVSSDVFCRSAAKTKMIVFLKKFFPFVFGVRTPHILHAEFALSGRNAAIGVSSVAKLRIGSVALFTALVSALLVHILVNFIVPIITLIRQHSIVVFFCILFSIGDLSFPILWIVVVSGIVALAANPALLLYIFIVNSLAVSVTTLLASISVTTAFLVILREWFFSSAGAANLCGHLFPMNTKAPAWLPVCCLGKQAKARANGQLYQRDSVCLDTVNYSTFLL